MLSVAYLPPTQEGNKRDSALQQELAGWQRAWWKYSRSSRMKYESVCF